MKNALLSAVTVFVLATGITVIAAAAGRLETNSAASPGTAAELYAKNCANCHGKDGQAKTFKAKFNHARKLTDPEWQGKVSDERIFNSISKGKGKMPGFAKKLSEAEIDSLVAYVRAFKK